MFAKTWKRPLVYINTDHEYKKPTTDSIAWH
jgi:hypothetical protein